MTAETQRPQNSPEQMSEARLVAAAALLLADVPTHPANFGPEAVRLMRGEGGDTTIADMIELSNVFTELDQKMTDRDIQEETGMPVIIDDKAVYGYTRPGRLIALEGSENLGDGRPMMYGVAVVTDAKRKESLIRVAITRNGKLFAKPIVRYHPDYKNLI